VCRRSQRSRPMTTPICLRRSMKESLSARSRAGTGGCAPSLIARHVAKAKRLRELRDLEQVPEADLSIGPIDGSTREILEARIRDPKTPARDLANLANALARLRFGSGVIHGWRVVTGGRDLSAPGTWCGPPASSFVDQLAVGGEVGAKPGLDCRRRVRQEARLSSRPAACGRRW
jgi:hypothetical protein